MLLAELVVASVPESSCLARVITIQHTKWTPYLMNINHNLEVIKEIHSNTNVSSALTK